MICGLVGSTRAHSSWHNLKNIKGISYISQEPSPRRNSEFKCAFRKLKFKYEASYDIREKTDFLMPYLFHHGNAGARKVTDMLMSHLFGGANNVEDWRMLLGLAWKM